MQLPAKGSPGTVIGPEPGGAVGIWGGGRPAAEEADAAADAALAAAEAAADVEPAQMERSSIGQLRAQGAHPDLTASPHVDPYDISTFFASHMIDNGFRCGRAHTWYSHSGTCIPMNDAARIPDSNVLRRILNSNRAERVAHIWVSEYINAGQH